MFGQTGLREALGPRAKREKLGAACARIVQREARQHGVLSRLRGTGQPGVLRKRERDEIVDRGGHGGVGLRHSAFCLHRGGTCPNLRRSPRRRFPEWASTLGFFFPTGRTKLRKDEKETKRS